jgi:protein phosphatase 1 regulatory subunit 42
MASRSMTPVLRSRQSGDSRGKGRPKKITLDVILSSTSLTRSSTESTESYLQRVTHLHLQAKRIQKIEALEQCTNLKVLYLYDNQIDRIENLEFATTLQYLNLANNNIKELPDMQLPHLTKLYMDDNEVTFVAGLEPCAKLEELHLSNQRIPTFSSVTFDPNTLMALSRSLQILEISGNGIRSLEQFLCLTSLRKLFCANNEVTELSEVEAIVGLYRLAEATFSGNPCCSHRRYRDSVMAASSDSLRILDGVPLLRHQQIAVRGLVAHRKKLVAAYPFPETQGDLGDLEYDVGAYDLQDGGGEI